MDIAAVAKPESATSPGSETDLIQAPRDKNLAATSLPLTTCLSLVSQDTAKCMIFDAARDTYDMDVYEGPSGGEAHRDILDSLKWDHTDEIFPRLAGSVQAVSRPMDWSLTM